MFEEAGLFQELQPEFTTPEATPHVNPFEADFRRASNGEIAAKELGHAPGTSEPLNTPCIPPVTADPIALRASFTPASAIVPNFESAVVACAKTEPPSDSSVSSLPIEKQSAQPSTAKEKGSGPLEAANVVTMIAEGTEEALLSPLVDDKAAVLQAVTCADPQPSMTGAIPAASVHTVTAPVAQVLEAPKVEPTPIVAQAIGALPGPKATIITSSNVIQVTPSGPFSVKCFLVFALHDDRI